MKSIQHFIEKGLVISGGKGTSTESGGKKPELYSFACKQVLLTIALWPNLFKITLSHLNAKKIATFEMVTPIQKTAVEAFALVAERALGLLGEYGYETADLYGVSMSTAGIIDYEHGILKYSSMSPEWGNNIEIEKHLRTIFGERVELIVENAGKMAGRAELTVENIDEKRILVLFSTWGFSACFIERGRVLNGQNSLIGEIGHMVIDPHDAERCGCGSYGCAERLISKERICKMIKEQSEAYPGSSLLKIAENGLTHELLFEHSAQGDILAREIVVYLAKVFAGVIRNISLSFDPDIVVFQGDYAAADCFFIETLKEQLGNFRYYPKEGPFELQFDKRSLEELDFVGAVNFLQHRFFKNELLYR